MPTYPYLYGDDLVDVLKKKHAAGTYKSLVRHRSSVYFCSAWCAAWSNGLRCIVILFCRYFTLKPANLGASLRDFCRMTSVSMRPPHRTQRKAVGERIAPASTPALRRNMTPAWATCTAFLGWKTGTLFLDSSSLPLSGSFYHVFHSDAKIMYC